MDQCLVSFRTFVFEEILLLKIIVTGYQGWGASPQQQPYNYNNAPGSYQGWGAPPGPQGPPPPQWSSYGGPQQTQSYGAYDMYSNTNTGGPSGEFFVFHYFILILE